MSSMALDTGTKATLDMERLLCILVTLITAIIHIPIRALGRRIGGDILI